MIWANFYFSDFKIISHAQSKMQEWGTSTLSIPNLQLLRYCFAILHWRVEYFFQTKHASCKLFTRSVELHTLPSTNEFLCAKRADDSTSRCIHHEMNLRVLPCERGTRSWLICTAWRDGRLPTLGLLQWTAGGHSLNCPRQFGKWALGCLFARSSELPRGIWFVFSCFAFVIRAAKAGCFGATLWHLEFTSWLRHSISSHCLGTAGC